jgi:hypothetical protein
MSYYHVLSWIFLALLTCPVHAEFDGEDIHVPSFKMEKISKTFLPRYTLLEYDVEEKEDLAMSKFSDWIAGKNQTKSTDKDELMEDLVSSFLDTPYGNGEGEGRWCNLDRRGCAHVKELPLFRIDKMNCQTFVQSGLALVQSHSLEDFRRKFIAVKYGAANQSNQISYFNRNNFVSASLNSKLRRIRFTTEPTYSSGLVDLQEITSALITRNKWFAKQFETAEKLRNHVLVQIRADGEVMADRFANAYPRNLARYSPLTQSISYLPKSHFFTKDDDSDAYTVKMGLFEELPTPSIVEIIRNPKKWTINGLPIAQVIGSELNVSHMGFLHRKKFRHREEITTLIHCNYDVDQRKACVVTPLTCEEEAGCREIMFSHATSAYPNSYIFYRDKSANYHCKPKLPDTNELDQSFPPTSCNRLVSVPLASYMSAKMYGRVPFLDSDSILGIHLEKILWDL